MDALSGIGFLSSLTTILPNFRLIHRINVQTTSTGSVYLDGKKIANSQPSTSVPMYTAALRPWKGGLVCPPFQSQILNRGAEDHSFLSDPFFILEPWNGAIDFTWSGYNHEHSTETIITLTSTSMSIYAQYPETFIGTSVVVFLFNWD